MNTKMKSLISDPMQYTESFFMYLERSTEHQCVQRFINTKLPDTLSEVGNGKSAINVLSLGSGTGEMDLLILSKLQEKYPGVLINNDVVEPSEEHILIYKENVLKTENLDDVHFTWYKQDTTEFMNEITTRKEVKKYDFIHMIQMIYYVKDVSETLKFFMSCLSPNGKLLIIVLSNRSGWINFYDKCGSQLPQNDLPINICSAEIMGILDKQGFKYEHYDIESNVEITECFIEGNKNGQLLLSMLTETCDFNETAPANLRALVLNLLQSPEYSSKNDGKTLLNTNLTVILLDGQ